MPIEPQDPDCACVHSDRFECFILRYATVERPRQFVEMEAKLCGGCECDCHCEYEDFQEAA